MINDRLMAAYRSFDNWCTKHGVTYDICVDEDNIQGYLVPRRYDALASRLSSFLKYVADKYGLFCCEQRTRSGTVYGLSLLAISESMMEALIPAIDKLRLARRLDLVFAGSNASLSEWQYNQPTAALRRQYTRPTETIGVRLNKKLNESFGYMPVIENLDGIAADYQPLDVLGSFEAALRDLGLLDQLRKSKVTNKLSPDKQIIHFYVPDADGRQREIASYELAKLAEGSNMEEAIKDLIDIARRRAPGTTDREAEEIKKREQYIRNVAKQYAPAAQQADQNIPNGDMSNRGASNRGQPAPTEDISPALRQLLDTD